jgi:hypothetical protein
LGESLQQSSELRKMTAQSGPEAYAPPKRRPSANSANEPGTETKEKLESLVGRVLGSTLDEIDHIIAELENVRNELRNEGGRVERLLVNYIALSNATMSGMKIISDSLKVWQRPSERSE